ncbi:hypothetical protein HZA38_04805 [Candidatus Peregrinibacteria bacterium]|nr:hypothetical protein [Candidatus Peregrinibacteria bacterium]
MPHSHIPKTDADISPKLLEEFYSHSLNYKASIFLLPEESGFEVNISLWRDSSEIQVPLWERIGGPFHVEKEDLAKTTAREHLELLSGERKDDKVSPEVLKWVKEYSGDENAEFLLPANYEIHAEDAPTKKHGEKNLKVKSLLIVYDLFVLEVDRNFWKIGTFREEDGSLTSWGKFSSLKAAINALGMKTEEKK